jgi:hypothetical protein
MLTAAAMALICTAMAQAETSIYVVEQPELSFLLEAKGDGVYAAYLRAELLCYGAGAHWYEGPQAVTHRAFQVGPVRVQSEDGRLRLLRTHRGPFDSWHEAIKGEVQPDRIVGTFSYFASGEGLGGSCESNAPGFEPEFGQREPPMSFEARRYVPLGSPLATAPDPAAASLYFQSSRQLETFFWVDGSTVTKLQGAARETCTTRGGDRDVRRRSLEPAPPFSVEAGEGRFEARAEKDWPYEVAASRLEGTVHAEGAVGRYRAAIAYREGRRKPFHTRCRTGGRLGDGYVAYHATRYVPVASDPATARG